MHLAKIQHNNTVRIVKNLRLLKANVRADLSIGFTCHNVHFLALQLACYLPTLLVLQIVQIFFSLDIASLLIDVFDFQVENLFRAYHSKRTLRMEKKAVRKPRKQSPDQSAYASTEGSRAPSESDTALVSVSYCMFISFTVLKANSAYNKLMMFSSFS